MRLFLLLLAALTFHAGSANAQTPGSADPTWTPPATTVSWPQQQWQTLATQSDSKVLMVMRSNTFIVRRYDHSGRLDASFGAGGSAVVNVYPGETEGQMDGTITLAVDALDRIYVAGRVARVRMNEGVTDTEIGYAVARLLSNGAMDGSFGNNGVVRIPVEQATTGGGADPQTDIERMFRADWLPEYWTMALQPDGKVLLLTAGKEQALPDTMHTVALVRLQANGQRDAAFANNGILLLRRDGTGGIREISANQDGSMIILGTDNQLSSGYSDYLLKLTPQGAIDTSFGTGGTQRFSNIGLLQDMLLQPDGRILVSGTAPVPGSFHVQAAISRLMANGAVDTSFGNGGISLQDLTISPVESASYLALEPNGKILVAVNSGTDPFDRGPHLIRLLANGARDTAFVTPEIVDRQLTSLAVADGAYLLAQSYTVSESPTPSGTATVRKFITDPLPRSGSLSTGQTPSVSGFRIASRTTNGIEVDTARLPHVLGLSGTIFTQSTDVNATADIFVVAATSRGLYMRNTSGAFVPWNNQVSTLVPAYEDVTLTSSTHVPIYAGQLPFAGTYYLYVGYMRSDGGPLIYIDEPAALEVTQ